jgi:hypothetical protein
MCGEGSPRTRQQAAPLESLAGRRLDDHRSSWSRARGQRGLVVEPQIPCPASTSAAEPGSIAPIRSGRLSATQEGLIHPGVNVDAVAGSHVDEVLQAGAVSRYLIRIVRLDRGEKPLLGRRDLYLQLLTHERHLLPGADIAGWRAGGTERWAGERCPG